MVVRDVVKASPSHVLVEIDLNPPTQPKTYRNAESAASHRVRPQLIERHGQHNTLKLNMIIPI